MIDLSKQTEYWTVRSPEADIYCLCGNLICAGSDLGENKAYLICEKCGQPWETQLLIRPISDEEYRLMKARG